MNWVLNIWLAKNWNLDREKPFTREPETRVPKTRNSVIRNPDSRNPYLVVRNLKIGLFACYVLNSDTQNLGTRIPIH